MNFVLAGLYRAEDKVLKSTKTGILIRMGLV